MTEVTSGRLMLQKKRLAFPAIFSPAAIGDGEPAYGGKLIIEPTDADVAKIEATIKAVATAKWGAKAEQILELLKEDKKIAFVKGPYRNSKTGDVYDGFEGMYHLSTRNPETRPTALDGNSQPTTQADGLIYGGCFVHASVEFWAQDNKWGRRINCNLRGVMYAGEGPRFGGTAPAKADEFAGLAGASEVPDFV
jgi:hypothetical protein